MKVRMEENSLRLRLKQKEVEAFSHKGEISSSTRFDLQAGSFISFVLRRDTTVEDIRAEFEHNEIRVLVPAVLADRWIGSDEEGFDVQMPIGENQTLYILVEKDFRCLHKGPDHKEDIDSFPHPMEGNKKIDCN